MAYEIPTTEPSEIIAGNTISWKRPEDSNFPIADGWELSYALVNSSGRILISTTDSGDGHHLVSVDPVTSLAYTVGDYSWQAYISDGTDRYLLDSGTITILPDFATQATGYDSRSHWKIVLENIEAVIQGRATKDQSSYTINGRQLSRTPMADLIVLYDKAKSNVASEERAERIANGLGNPGKIKVRFV